MFLLCGGHGGCVGVVDGHDGLMGFSDLTRKNLEVSWVLYKREWNCRCGRCHARGSE